MAKLGQRNGHGGPALGDDSRFLAAAAVSHAQRESLPMEAEPEFVRGRPIPEVLLYQRYSGTSVQLEEARDPSRRRVGRGPRRKRLADPPGGQRRRCLGPSRPRVLAFRPVVCLDRP